MAPARPGH